MRGYVLKAVGGFALVVALAVLIGNVSPYPEVKSLPFHALSTVTRIFVTLVISVLWGVSFGILAATNRTASIIITPIVDLLQSIPILGYFPLVIGFLFSWGTFGIELSIILLLFTSMAWAVFFGVIGAVKAIPANVIDASNSFRISGWRYTRHVVIPAITPAIIAGANLAWSDGWFFMIAAEYIQYKSSVVVPPSGGVGMLLAKAAYEWKDMNMAVILLVFITTLVIVVNSLTWHKLMERASMGTFKPIIHIGLSGVGKLGSQGQSWLDFRNIQAPKAFSAIWQRIEKYSRQERITAGVAALVIILYIVSGEFHRLPTMQMIQEAFSAPPGERAATMPLLVALTMGRLATAYLISLVIAIGLGVLAAENKLAASIIYPIYDVGQGVPILALFPVIYLGITPLVGSERIALEITCILMLVLDMIWYMFINITSAVKNIPTDIKEVANLFGFKGIKRIIHIIVPSILPAIVTGSILSWGTGWNTIIFSEYLPSTEPGVPAVSVPGIGSFLDEAGYVYGNTILLVFILVVISVIVLGMEVLIWRRLLRKFEKFKVEV